jgi:UDP-glucose 6-dehydrogenase
LITSSGISLSIYDSIAEKEFLTNEFYVGKESFTKGEEMMKKTDKIVKHDVEHILEDLSMSHLIKRVPNKKMFTYDDLLEIIDIPLQKYLKFPQNLCKIYS